MGLDRKVQRMSVLKKLRKYDYVAALSECAHADAFCKEKVRAHEMMLGRYATLCDDLAASPFLKETDPAMMSVAISFVDRARGSVAVADKSRLEAEAECRRRNDHALKLRFELKTVEKAWDLAGHELMQARSAQACMEAAEMQIYRGTSDE